jgi:hypothetical protein
MFLLSGSWLTEWLTVAAEQQRLGGQAAAED